MEALFALLFSLIIIYPLVILCSIGLAIAALIFWIVTLIELANAEIPDKPMWIVIVMFGGPIGALVYRTAHRPRGQSTTVYRPNRAPVYYTNEPQKFMGLTSINVLILGGGIVAGMLLCIGLLFVIGFAGANIQSATATYVANIAETQQFSRTQIAITNRYVFTERPATDRARMTEYAQGLTNTANAARALTATDLALKIQQANTQNSRTLQTIAGPTNTPNATATKSGTPPTNTRTATATNTPTRTRTPTPTRTPSRNP